MCAIEASARVDGNSSSPSQASEAENVVEDSIVAVTSLVVLTVKVGQALALAL